MMLDDFAPLAPNPHAARQTSFDEANSQQSE